MAAPIFVACHKDESSENETPPTLTVVPVNLVQLNSHIAFGEVLSSNLKSPAIEYITDDDMAQVFASCEGYVVAIEQNEGYSDYEIRVNPAQNSQWTIIYDHVINVMVTVGQDLIAGDVLGNVGEGNRTELQLNKNTNGHNLSYCPLNFGSDIFNEKHRSISGSWCLEETVTP